MSRAYRVTDAHFRAYQRYARAALRDLGVNDWQIGFEHASLSGLANVSHAACDRVATLRLARTWDEPPTPERLREAARHEAIHLALASMSAVGRSRYVTCDEVEAAEEATVQRFLRCVRWRERA